MRGRRISGRRASGIGAATALTLALAPTAAPAAEPGPPPLHLQPEGCDEHVGIFPVPRAAVDLELPDGFALADPMGLDPSDRSAAVLVIGVQCEQVSWQRGAHQHVRQDEPTLLVLVTVQPPPELALPGAAFHTVALAVLTGDPTHAAAMRSKGTGVHTGGIELTWPTPQSPAEHATLAEGDGVTVALHVRSEGSGLSAGLSHRIFTVRGEQVRGTLDVTDVPHPETAPGPATVHLTGLPLPSRLEGFGLTGLGLDTELTATRVLPASTR